MTPGWRRASPRSSSTSRRWRRSTCAAAGPARARARCSQLDSTVEAVDAIALSGGSALGLDAARRRAGLAGRARPRIQNPRGRDPDRARRDLLRSAERRRQGLGPVSALSRSRLCRGRCGLRRVRPRKRRRRHGRHHGQFQGRHRLGFGRDRRWRHGCRARGRQCRRQRDRRRRSVVLGGAVRDRRRIWPSWPAGVVHAGHARRAAERRACRRRLRKTPRWSWS